MYSVRYTLPCPCAAIFFIACQGIHIACADVVGARHAVPYKVGSKPTGADCLEIVVRGINSGFFPLAMKVLTSQNTRRTDPNL